ncbi:MAG: hypothetical protein BWK80_59050 [Desulfobacteraceae bacterium IS3]|nr:MAG: hypothetical protein BWK80_59050 [Desulfobacteraceae bacterium IS3]
MNPTYQNISYPGGMFDSASERGRAFGTISVTTDSLHFESPTDRLELPLNGISLNSGGAGDRMLFFTHDSFPDQTVFTGDHGILNNASLMSYSHIAGQAIRIREVKKQSRRILTAVIVLLLGCIYGIFQLKEPVVIATAKRIPLTWEQKLGKATVTQLKAGKPFIGDAEILEQLESLAKPLLSRIPEKQYDFVLHLAKDPEINAFALPGGHIVLNTGLLLTANSAEEVIGVLAHEAAHITLQHGLRQLIGTAGLYALVQTFFGDTGGLMAVFINNGTFLLTQKYSRDYEREADDRGWEYLIEANLDPRGMIAFFDRLSEEQKKDALNRVGDSLNFLSTHPATTERIKSLRKKWEKLDRHPEYVSTDQGFQAFKEKLKKLQVKSE